MNEISERALGLREMKRKQLNGLVKKYKIKVIGQSSNEDKIEAIVAYWHADAEKRLDHEKFLGSAEIRVIWILYAFVLLVVNTPETLVGSLEQSENLVQNIFKKFCHLHVTILDCAPYYLHRLKSHFFEMVGQVGALRKFANYIMEGLSQYQKSFPTRNGGLGSSIPEDMLITSWKYKSAGDDALWKSLISRLVPPPED